MVANSDKVLFACSSPKSGTGRLCSGSKAEPELSDYGEFLHGLKAKLRYEKAK